MSMRSWIRNVFARPAVRALRKALPACRPAVEALEGRLVPTTFTVSRLADDALAGSLRWAITQANTVAGDDLINFSVTGSINLGGLLPDLNSNIDIQGPGPGSLTVRRNTGGDYGIFRVLAGRTVALSGLTIANGSGSSPNGGGITNNGTLTLSNSTLSGNSGSGGSGGGITNTGTLTVSNSTLSGNSVQFYGGGIRNEGTLTVSNSTLVGNSAPGGGIGRGGGIANFGTLTVSNSTLSGNSANQYGGGIASSGPLTVSNSTLAGNSVTDTQFGRGGGIYHQTIPPSSITLNNSLVVNSPSGGDIWSTVTGSNNLTGSVALGPLQNNGGPTPTHALPAGSPALNAGSNALIPPGVTTDQRGAGFLRIGGGTVDIGAVEAQTRTWSGAGVDGNWTTAANWQGGVAPLPGDDLAFPAGAARPSNSNTFAASTVFRSLTFGGAGYTLGGNALTLTNGLTHTAAGNNSVVADLALGGDQTLTTAAGAQLTLSGAVTGGVLSKAGTGQVNVAGALAPASFTLTAGTVVIDAVGGLLTTLDYVQQGGTLHFNGGYLAPGGVADFRGGAVSGDALIIGNAVNTAATIHIGGSGRTGYFVVTGNFTNAAGGVVNMELAGPEAVSQYDVMVVGGATSLAGTLNVSRLGGYVPAPEDFFLALYSVGPLTGQYTTVTGLVVSPERTLVPTYDSNFLWLF